MRRYDDLKSADENIDLQSTILSRFDLIFIVKDERNAARDEQIARCVEGNGYITVCVIALVYMHRPLAQLSQPVHKFWACRPANTLPRTCKCLWCQIIANAAFLQQQMLSQHP